MENREFKTEEDVHRELGRVLGRAPNEMVWALLVEDRLPSNVVDPWPDDDETGSADDAEVAFAELVDKYRRTERLLDERGALNGRRASKAALPEQERTAASTEALTALSAIMALEAESHPLVVAFRESVLDGALLPPDRYGPWLSEHDVAAATRPSMLSGGLLSLPARESPWDARVDAERYASGDLPARGHEGDYLACVIDALRDTYGWSEWSHVARFVLCGETPRLFAGIARMIPRERFFPKTASVVLIVNPQMEPRRLMDLYAEMRRFYVPPNTRIRPPGAAASRLAVFVARHNDGSTWQDVWAAWNAENDRQYADVRSFARDARKAYARVTGEGIEWRAGKDDGSSRESGRPVNPDERGSK